VVRKLSHLYLSVIIFIIGSFLLSGCLEELHDATPGEAVANIYPVASMAYFASITQEIIIDIGVFANDGYTVSSIDITKQLFLLSGDSSGLVTYSLAVTPADTLAKLSQSKVEIFADVPINDIVLSENDLAAGDNWQYTYKFSLSNGNVLSKKSGTIVTFLCPSSLAGTFDVVSIPWCGTPVSMEATWVEVGDGVYTTTDFTYGAYAACYNGWGGTPDGSLQINDVCNLIFPTGESQWQEEYTYSNGTTSGISFAFDWINDYGESGSVTLIRQDGQDWPPLRTE
jgi:hypothetical protein